MPLYDFRCVKCDKLEERLVSHGDIETQICNCEQQCKMIRQENVSSMQFALKGRWFKNNKSY